MRSILSLLAWLSIMLVLAPVGTCAESATEERLVPEDRLAQDVEVRDVRADDGTVSGTVVNRSGKTLRDVRLVVRHQWLWSNEFHPGTNDPSRADYYTLPGEIPPGGRAEFTYRPATPLPEARAGRFQTDVRVASVVEVIGGTAASPTAGTRARPTVEEERLQPERQ